MELSEVKPGSIILAERPFKCIDHYGIYAGHGEVIHYAPCNEGDTPIVHRASIDRFVDSAPGFFVPYMPENEVDVKMMMYWHRRQRSIPQEITDNLFNMYKDMKIKVYTAEQTLRRALKRLGETKYDLLGNNCEHFALWCKFKTYISKQVSRIYEFFKTALLRLGTQRYHRFVTVR
ncbi:lecithin retinol acyltransferase family protein [Selenomonas bovis]|uniref:lecithin retinol acyltransferase family protein n=1 Tax=Selenomonas bovis TaxID=416586 RepID=UPI003CFFE706